MCVGVGGWPGKCVSVWVGGQVSLGECGCV